MLEYSQRDVHRWWTGGRNQVDVEFSMVEPCFLLSVRIAVDESTALSIHVDRLSPEGTAYNQRLFDFTGCSATNPINWRLLDESELHLINPDQPIRIYMDAAVEGMQWSSEIWAVPMSKTDRR